jgi:acid phosphatase (class A)
VAHADIKPCVPKEPGYSFPSGHATFYSATSVLLADLLPERRERIMEVGKSVGANRVICAMHYPSDIEAGVRLGQAGAAQILQSSAWKQFKARADVQAEVNAIKAIPANNLPLIVR